MTDDDIKRLRELAKAATPGPWKYTVCDDYGCGITRPGGWVDAVACSWEHKDEVADTQYIAAVGPDVVLRMLDEIDALRAFAWDLMEPWPIYYGGISEDTLDDAAIKHGLLIKRDPRPTAPCGPLCGCAKFATPRRWAAGIDCWMRAPLLTGGA